MKRLITLAVILTTSQVLAQVAPVTNPQLATKDLVEFVGIEQMPVPIPQTEAEKTKINSAAKAVDGFSSVEKSPELVRGFFRNVNDAKARIADGAHPSTEREKGFMRAPEAHKDLSTVKLSFKPAIFAKSKLVAAVPSGTLINDAWTGLDRFFEVAGIGVIRLAEQDLGASQGKFYMLKEAVNARINGKPAISKVFVDENGQFIEEVVWVSGNKFYMLTYGPQLISGTKNKAASHVSAHSLAQELR
jgi:hypothetical protein